MKGPDPAMALADKQIHHSIAQPHTGAWEHADHSVVVQLSTYPVASTWYAECLELTLLTRGATPDEAVNDLRDQIVSYIRTVVEKGWEQECIPRPASMRHRLRLFARIAFARVRRRRVSTVTEAYPLH